MIYYATKPFSYANRRLLPGDEFDVVKPIHGKLLVAVKKARVKRDPGKIAAPAKAVTEKVMPQESPSVTVIDETEDHIDVLITGAYYEDAEGNPITAAPDDLSVLRAQAEKLGIAVDGRWGARRLQSAIEEATAEAE